MYKNPADILEALKGKTLKVARLSKETGIPSSRIYKWVDRGSKITSEDADTLKEWIAKLDKSRENGTTNDLQTIARDFTEATIRHEAAINIMAMTLAEMLAGKSGKSTAYEHSELLRTISSESDRLKTERRKAM